MRTKSGFTRYELHPRVLDALPALGYRRPTPVQERVIPRFIQKRNLIVEAPTGTGKTAAYGLPLISRLDLTKRNTQAMVLVPSRELAVQALHALSSFFAGDQLKVGAVYGGVSMEESFRQIKQQPHILIAVPGRLRDVMSHTQYDYLWRDIKFLIVDEGDKMLESGFQKDFDELNRHLRNRIQVCFCSATISEDSEALIRERFSKIETIRLSPKEMLGNIRFTQTEIQEGKRAAYLGGLLTQKGLEKALIFCGRREEIFGIVGFLRNCGYRAEAYYGNQPQAVRTQILGRFREGHLDYLVASDLAARGLDIESLPAVINLNIPQEYDFYLHRVGRTGRAGNKGAVYNLINSGREAAYLSNHHRNIGLRLKTLAIQPLANQQAEAAMAEPWGKFLLSRGKRDKVGRGDILGFMVQTLGLEAKQVGTINILDTHSIVDLPKSALKQSPADLDHLKIKGKTVKIRPYQVEEQQKRAKDIRDLKRDRKKM